MEYVTGTGQTIYNVHSKSDNCDQYGCVIHNPSDGPMKDFPTHWRGDRRLMERICPHGIGHPDHNLIEFYRRTIGEAMAKAESIHGCDGCCQ